MIKEVLRNAKGYHIFGVTIGNVWGTRRGVGELTQSKQRQPCKFGESGMTERIISLKVQADVAFKHHDILGHDCFTFIFNGIVQQYNNFTFGFLPSLANNARSLSCEGGAMKIIYGFKSEFRRVFNDCKEKIFWIFKIIFII